MAHGIEMYWTSMTIHKRASLSKWGLSSLESFQVSRSPEEVGLSEIGVYPPVTAIWI